jgi:hypothetical protein
MSDGPLFSNFGAKLSTTELLINGSNYGPVDSSENNHYLVFYPAITQEWVENKHDGVGASYGIYQTFTYPISAQSVHGNNSFSAYSAPYNKHFGCWVHPIGSSGILSNLDGDFTIEGWIRPESSLPIAVPEMYFMVGDLCMYGIDNLVSGVYWATQYGPALVLRESNSANWYAVDDGSGTTYADFIASGAPLDRGGSGSNHPYKVNGFTHYAVVRDTTGSTYADELRWYVGGTLLATIDLTSSGRNWAANKMSALASNGGSFVSPASNTYFQGGVGGTYYYFEDFRICSSVEYSGTGITVPSAAPLGVGRSYSGLSTTELLLKFDTGASDWGKNKFSITTNGYGLYFSNYTYPYCEISRTGGKFGGAASFNTENLISLDSVSVDDAYGNVLFNESWTASAILSDIIASGVDWTIEAWIKPISTKNTSEVYLEFGDITNTDGKLKFRLHDSDLLADNISVSPNLYLEVVDTYYQYPYFVGPYSQAVPCTPLIRNQWNHVVIQHNNSNNLLTTFVSGVPYSIDTQSISGWAGFKVWKGFVLGGGYYYDGFNAYASGLNGYVDEFRISSAAMYATGGFTPPSSALT